MDRVPFRFVSAAAGSAAGKQGVDDDGGILRKKPIRGWGEMKKSLTAIIEREDGGYVSFCPELDIASQGESIQEAKSNLREALELFFECASPAEIAGRLHDEVFVTSVEVAVG
jgi:predicted RNase H-like HicB family nuclease